MENPYKTFDEILINPVDTRLLVLLKIGIKEHLEELAAGRLRFRKLSYYSSNESKEHPCHDSNEGIESVLQSDRVKLYLKAPNNKEIELSTETGLTGAILIQTQLSSPIFCLHAVHTGDWTHREFTEEAIPQFREYLQIPASMKKHGTHVWTILNQNLFNERLRDAIKKCGYGLRGDLVKYADFASVHGSLSSKHRAFVKNKDYSEEREYRYLIQTKQTLPDPFVIDVGSLKDISQIMTLEEFNNNLEIRFPET